MLRTDDGQRTEFGLIKLRPGLSTTSGAASRADGSRPVRGSGTAFVVHPDGLLLTAHHVVENADSIDVSCSGQSAQAAMVRSASPSTDLALLEVEGLNVDAYLSFAQSGPELGEEVFTVGYPLVNLLGTEPKYTEGTISALSGPGGDASYVQISVPVQPGNSGGPLVNERGEVVGVVIATASAPAFFRASGTIPQNTNWAVKGVFAAALFSSPAPLLSPLESAPGSPIDRVRAATCLVVTR